MPRHRLPFLVVLALTALAGTAQGKAQPQLQGETPGAGGSDGVRHLHFRFGPIRVRPGQNTISFDLTRQRPKLDGFITSFRPNLVRASGEVPPVDVIHLHHAVWLVNLRPTWAAGER